MLYFGRVFLRKLVGVGVTIKSDKVKLGVMCI